MKTIFIIPAVLNLIIIFVWLRLQIQPLPFMAYQTTPSQEPQTIPLPADLPAPVYRFYWQLYGVSIPIINSTVISGTWQNESSPRARFTTMEVVYNSNVGTIIQNSGVE